MSAILFRIGSDWWVHALSARKFATAREARQWARANKLRIKRASNCDRESD
jgi:hypothetical protein